MSLNLVGSPSQFTIIQIDALFCLNNSQKLEEI